MFVLLLAPGYSYAQTISVESRTSEFTDYVISNDSLKAGYQFELMVANSGNEPSWRILEQEIVQRDIHPTEKEKLDLVLHQVPENAPVVNVLSPGVYRKQQVAT